MEGNFSKIDIIIEPDTFRSQCSNKPGNNFELRHISKGGING